MDITADQSFPIEHSSTASLLWSLSLAMCLIAAIVFFCVPQSMADPDIWWHLRDAQWQMAHHTFLHHDLFSFTAAGAAWMNHEWLSELPFFLGYRLLGMDGLYAITLITLEAIFLGLFSLAYATSRSVAFSCTATVLGIFLSTVSFGPRTLLFGWVLLLLELAILFRSSRQPLILWALPAVFLVWVNTHGSWIIGLVIFSLFALCRCVTLDLGCVQNRASSPHEIRQLAITWLLCVAALFVNPYGWRLVLYPFDLAFRQKLNIASIEEWKSVDFHSPRGRILLLSIVLIFLLQLVKQRSWSLFEMATSLLALYAGLTYSRFLFLAAILAIPSLATSLAGAFPAPRRRALRPMLNSAFCFLVLCFVVGKVRTRTSDATQADTRFPNQALPFLRSFQPQGRVFNEFLWGGLLDWNTPTIPVFIDSRVDIFEYNGTFKDYLDVVRLKNSLALLDKDRIRYVLFERDSPLIELLKTSGQWKTDYEDSTTALVERVDVIK